MGAERVKWWGAIAAGVVAGMVVMALWKDAQAWRGAIERRMEALESSALAVAATPGQALADASKVLAASAGREPAPKGCVGASPAPSAAGSASTGGMSAEEWLAREDARS